MRNKVLFAAVLAAALAVAAPSFAQLPPVVEGVQNPTLVFGASYLKTDPGPGFHRAGVFIAATIPGLIKVGPCYLAGVGVAGETIDPSLKDLPFGMAFPIATCVLNQGQWGFQGGYAKILNTEDKPDAWYFGATFSFTSPAKLSYKRALKKAKMRGTALPPCPESVCPR